MLTEEMSSLVVRMRDYRTRRDAMYQAEAIGRDVVPIMISLLSDRTENVRWCAGEILKRIATRDDVPQIATKLTDPRARELVISVLQELTGEDLGTDPDAWIQKYAPGAEEKSTTIPEDEKLLNAALAGTGLSAEQVKGVYRIRVPLEGDRHQTVYVSFASRDREGDRLIAIYTKAGPADEKFYENALRENLRMALASIGVHEEDGEKSFVVCSIHLRDSTTAQELKKGILAVAKRGDALERALSSEDKF